MKKNVTLLQVFSLYNLHIFTTVIAFLLGMLITGSGFSTPIATVLGAFLTILMIYPSYKVGSARPDEFITEYGGELVGRIPHAFFILYIVIIKLLLSAINLREMADFLLTEYLSGTPHWAILFIFCVCIGYAVRSGVTVIFRSAQGIFLISALAFLLIPILAMQEIEFDALIALVTHLNIRDLSTGIYLNMGMYGELSFLFVMYPYLKDTKKVYRTFFITDHYVTYDPDPAHLRQGSYREPYISGFGVNPFYTSGLLYRIDGPDSHYFMADQYLH